MTCDHGQCVPKTDSFKANLVQGPRPTEVVTMIHSTKHLLRVNHLNLGINLCINNVGSTFRLLKLGFNVFNSFGHQTSHDAASFKAAGNCKNLFLPLALVGYLTCALYYYLLG